MKTISILILFAAMSACQNPKDVWQFIPADANQFVLIDIEAAKKDGPALLQTTGFIFPMDNSMGEHKGISVEISEAGWQKILDTFEVGDMPLGDMRYFMMVTIGNQPHYLALPKEGVTPPNSANALDGGWIVLNDDIPETTTTWGDMRRIEAMKEFYNPKGTVIIGHLSPDALYFSSIKVKDDNLYANLYITESTVNAKTLKWIEQGARLVPELTLQRFPVKDAQIMQFSLPLHAIANFKKLKDILNIPSIFNIGRKNGVLFGYE